MLTDQADAAEVSRLAQSRKLREDISAERKTKEAGHRRSE
jgi:hypothetical protein